MAKGAAYVVEEGGHVWQERRPLQRTVRILLECILVVKKFLPNHSFICQTDTSIETRKHSSRMRTAHFSGSEGEYDVTSCLVPCSFQGGV